MTAIFIPAPVELLVAWVLLPILVVIPSWRICSRVGLAPGLSLLIVVPVVNLVFLWILAFGRWPAVDGVGAEPGRGN